MSRKWRGTALFAIILVTMGLTIGLKLYTGSGASLAAAPSAVGSPTAGAGTPSSQPTASASSSPSATSGSSSGSTSSGPTSSGSTSSAAATGTATISGAVEQTPYGPIQVSVTFSGTKITAVTELQSPNDRDRSIQINSQAAPILAHEVISAQSAQIDSVSGATYTSQGYAASVQAAIDKR
ncbi:MAG: FMN-binding protein [Microbacteriaceae bacterium]|nr:MAG: FMN-binding protein [Microbacteriaceae bacterium]